MDRHRLHGALLIDKFPGISSAGLLPKIKGMLRSYGYKGKATPKIGHGGTLDPFASGLLIVLIGQGTRLAEYFLGEDKTYSGEIFFGAKTLSGDTETEIVQKGLIPDFNATKGQFLNMRGPYLQIPPMYSAKQVEGRRLYKLARKGRMIERSAVSCELKELFLGKTDEDGVYGMEVKCSAGTFMRTLAEDLAERLGTVAHLKSLRRLACGSKKIDQAIEINELQRLTVRGEDWTKKNFFMGMGDLLSDRPQIKIIETHLLPVFQGHLGILQGIMSVFERQQQHVLIFESEVVALVDWDLDKKRWAYLKVFPLEETVKTYTT